MVTDGYDPLPVCDDESQDLEYIMSALSDEGDLLNEWTGEPMMLSFSFFVLETTKALKSKDFAMTSQSL
jgi:hypothetical protein